MRGKVPRIVWNGNTLIFGYPLDSAVSYSLAREGSEYIRNEAGVTDAWLKGEDHVLDGEVRWITPAQWEAASGWRAFLAWCRNGGTFAFFPDKDAGTNYTCTLHEPLHIKPDLETDSTRKLVLKFVTTTPINGY